MSEKSELEAIQKTALPNTISSLKRDFAALGLGAGDVVIMHSAMSKIGWIVGGAVAVIEALLEVLTPAGTLVMPTHTSANSDPAEWQHPPAPEAWWQPIRDEMPPFRPEISPTREMGTIVEIFRTWPQVLRSSHPQISFAAWGQHAAWITQNHPLEVEFGDASPLGRLYELDSKVLLLGVTHANNTSLHLAEARVDYVGKTWSRKGAAMLVNGQREWVWWQGLDYDSDDFERLGQDYEASVGFVVGKVGQAEARLLSQRAVVDFAMTWLPQHRPAPQST